MQLFSADTTIFFVIYFCKKSCKHRPQKLLIIGPNFCFQYCQPAQNQPHKNGSLRDFYTMTLGIPKGEKCRKCFLNSQDNKMSMEIQKIFDSIVTGNSLPPLD